MEGSDQKEEGNKKVIEVKTFPVPCALEENQVNLYSSLIIESIQSAWRKPINIQDSLVCNLRLSINKNGRVVNVNLIKSSGNIRFDNSAIKAVQRVETFEFFNKIPMNIYSSNFKNIVITFNPS